MQRIKFYLLILLFVSFMKIGIIEVHAISCPVSYTNLGGGVFEYEVIYDSDKRQFSIFPEIEEAAAGHQSYDIKGLDPAKFASTPKCPEIYVDSEIVGKKLIIKFSTDANFQGIKGCEGKKDCYYKIDGKNYHIMFDCTTISLKEPKSNSADIKYDISNFQPSNFYNANEEPALFCPPRIYVYATKPSSPSGRAGVLYIVSPSVLKLKDEEVDKYTDPSEVEISDETTTSPYQKKRKDSIAVQCQDFEDEEGNILKDIYRMIMLIVPILVILLGSLDLAKATFASDDEAMKKSQSNFMKRLLAAVILFLLPSLIKLMFYLAYLAGIVEKANPMLCIFN